MNDVLQFMIENSSWLKDVATIIFTGTATVVAILTYTRAKATILQPKRNEIIKIQTQTLIDFLNFISDDGNNLDSSVDYLNIYRYNFYLALKRYDLLDLEKDNELYSEMNLKIAGWCDYHSKLNNSGFAMIKGNLEDYDSIYLGKEDLSEYHSKIVITKKGWAFIENLRKMSNNPFLPNHIIETIDKIGNNMTDNLFFLMPNIINNEMLRIQSNNLGNVKPGVSYREFEKNRHQHIDEYKNLREKIRKYLSVDEKW